MGAGPVRDVGGGDAGGTTSAGLFAAEHRGLRELSGLARALRAHWTALAERLGEPPEGVLHAGAREARELVRELRAQAPGTPESAPAGPAALSAGRWLGAARNGAVDHLLERNQALRLAVLDAQHLTTLLAYLSELAERRGDGALAAFHTEWARRFRELEARAREAAVAAGRDPESAVDPAVPTAAGRAGHKVAIALGSLGEWLDRRAGRE